MNNLIKSAAALFLASGTAVQAQLIIFDLYTGNSAVTSGFALGEGVNYGINPPATRLTGSTVDNLRYMVTDTGRAATAYTLASGQLNIAGGTGNGRFTLSDDGTTAYNFGSVLGSTLATAANPVTYDVTISMDNDQSGTTRFSFALGTAEANANLWDFGIQLYKPTGSSTYNIGKRIDQVSCSLATDSTGSTGDKNSPILTGAEAPNAGTKLNFLMRITDAGAETTTFNSRVQLSMDGGGTWFYDTQSDPDLAGTGFRFDTADRYFMWDTAGGGSGTMKYDNFSVTMIPEPSAAAIGLMAGIWLLVRSRRR